jgi:hypothetical protein
MFTPSLAQYEVSTIYVYKEILGLFLHGVVDPPQISVSPKWITFLISSKLILVSRRSLVTSMWASAPEFASKTSSYLVEDLGI